MMIRPFLPPLAGASAPSSAPSTGSFSFAMHVSLGVDARSCATDVPLTKRERHHERPASSDGFLAAGNCRLPGRDMRQGFVLLEHVPAGTSWAACPDRQAYRSSRPIARTTRTSVVAASDSAAARESCEPGCCCDLE